MKNSHPNLVYATMMVSAAVLIGFGCSEPTAGNDNLIGTGGSTANTSNATNLGGDQARSLKSGSGGSSKRSAGDTTTRGTARNADGGTTSDDGEGGANGGADTQGGEEAGGRSSTETAGGARSPAGGSANPMTSAALGGMQARGGSEALGGATTGTTSLGTSSAAAGGTTSTKAPTYGGGGAASLREKYADLFPIGAAVDSQSYTSHSALLKQHFSSITLENEMKFDALQPTEGNFTYGTADSIVSFATSNNMKVRGHALVWHRQVPAWVFSSGSSTEVLKKMKSHITSVMKHFEKSVYAWDVVNEAIMDDGKFRTGDEAKEDQRSQWYKVVGESYIAEAFRYAREAAPSAKLFYNDYYNYVPARRTAIYNLLKGLIADGVPIDGVGLQAHFNIEPSTVETHQGYYQNVAELEEAIKLYSSLGLDVQITEMDVSLYVPGVTYTTETFYTTATFTEAVQTKQAERYREFFNLYREYKDVITGVTLWGVADDNTWLSEFSSGRKDFPLLFDTNKKPKKAYYAVVDF